MEQETYSSGTELSEEATSSFSGGTGEVHESSLPRTMALLDPGLPPVGSETSGDELTSSEGYISESPPTAQPSPPTVLHWVSPYCTYV